MFYKIYQTLYRKDILKSLSYGAPLSRGGFAARYQNTDFSARIHLSSLLFLSENNYLKNIYLN